MRTALHVREARGDDWRAMAAIFRDAGKAAWGEILPSEALDALAAPDRWETAIYRQLFDGAVFVVEAEATVVGFAVLRTSEDEGALPLTGEIDALYTAPRFWGRGAGQALMNAVLAKARELRFSRLTLWTEERNTRAKKFYELAGWRDGHGVRQREVHGVPITETRYIKET